MRIISGFKDYYDSPAFVLGDVPVYVREKKEIDINDSDSLFVKNNMQVKLTKDLRSNRYFIGYRDFKGKYDWLRSSSTYIFCVGNEVYLGWWNSDKLIAPYTSDYKWLHRLSMDDAKHVSPFSDFIIKWVKENREKISIAPVFVWPLSRQTFLIENPRLHDFQFETAVDAFTTATLIDTYISNMAVNKDIPVEISDIIRIESAGFDTKTSFRKSPSKAKK